MNPTTSKQELEVDDILERTLEEIISEEVGQYTKPLIKRLAKYVLKIESNAHESGKQEERDRVLEEVKNHLNKYTVDSPVPTGTSYRTILNVNQFIHFVKVALKDKT